MPNEFEKAPPAELNPDEAALLKEMPELDGIGQSRRTFMLQTVAGGIGVFAANLLAKESALAQIVLEPDAASIHEAFHNTSSFETFSDNTTAFTKQIYACPNLHAPLKIAATDLSTPTLMRAPGAVSGMFALESAMDELAYALKVDPLELRLINYAEVDPERASRSPARLCVSATVLARRSSYLSAMISNGPRSATVRILPRGSADEH